MRFIAFAFALAATWAHAQPYPAKPIRIVVPYTAGGPADLLVRALGQKLTDAWGQQVIVENKPGANEIIAAQEVAHSPADGYNWLLASDDRKSTRLNSSHMSISYAVFCLKKKK